jgi:starch synthase
MSGIPHGVDYAQTNPPLEKLLGKRQKSQETNGKAGCRKALLDQLEIEQNSSGIALALPIEPQDESAFGSVKPVLDLVLTADTSLVVTGKAPEQDLAEIIVAERKYPTRFAYRPDADSKLRQLSLAGADVALLPSSLGFRGTNVLAAMRYGTLPVVSSRGGVRQLVSDYDPVSESGSGFVYTNHSQMALWDSIRRAKQLYREPEEWTKVVRRAQAVDFSWAESAKAFAKLYANLLRHRYPSPA